MSLTAAGGGKISAHVVNWNSLLFVFFFWWWIFLDEGNQAANTAALSPSLCQILIWGKSKKKKKKKWENTKEMTVLEGKLQLKSWVLWKPSLCFYFPKFAHPDSQKDLKFSSFGAFRCASMRDGSLHRSNDLLKMANESCIVLLK